VKGTRGLVKGPLSYVCSTNLAYDLVQVRGIYSMKVYRDTEVSEFTLITGGSTLSGQLA
jgi:hypothetical protein